MKPYFIQRIKIKFPPAEVAAFLSNHREGECRASTCETDKEEEWSGARESEMCTVQFMHSTHANLYSCGKETVVPRRL
jgi:hypothetical protein